MKKIIAIVHTPPPTHGAALVGKKVIEKISGNSNFRLKTIRIKASSDIREIGAFSFGKVFSSLSMLFCLLRGLILFKPDVIYFTASLNGFALLRDAILMLAIRMFRVPRVCIHLHTIGVRRNLNKKWTRILYYLLFNNSEVITLSEYSKEDLQYYFDVIKKVHILPNSCPDEPTLKQVSHVHDHQCGVYSFVYLSNLMDEKGYKLALELAKELKELNLFQFTFKFAGSWGTDDDKEFFYKYLSEHRMETYVQYLGMVSGESKYELLTNGDVLVFPSFYSKESFPLVLLEAMAYEMAIITTNHAAIPYIVNEEFALLCPSQKKLNAKNVVDFLSELQVRKTLAKKHYNMLYSDRAFEIKLFDILGVRSFNDKTDY